MELSLRLDQDGRTAHEMAGVASASASASASSSTQSSVDYSSKTLLTKLADISDSDQSTNLLDDLLFDAEIADCALLPRTFWMPAEGVAPRCRLEQMALEVFHRHVPKDGYVYDKSTSGAEWWVQIRPSPSAGRYSMLADASSSSTKDEENKSGDEVDHDMSKSGISFHWDKDEDLRLAMGGDLYIHPHLSTVSYLTDLGAPTIALNYRIDATTGDYIEPSSDGKNPAGYVSWPKVGKHLSFDGRLLHAAPGDLMKNGEFEEQCKFDRAGICDDKKKYQILQRRHRRTTFLVNIWLNFKPINVTLFPEGMIDKLSSQNDGPILFDETNAPDSKEEKSTGRRCEHKSLTVPSKGSDNDVMFSWPMGGCHSDERINISVPLSAIQEERNNSGNVCIEWVNEKGVAIVKGGGDRKNGGVEGCEQQQQQQQPEMKKQKTG